MRIFSMFVAAMFSVIALPSQASTEKPSVCMHGDRDFSGDIFCMNEEGLKPIPEAFNDSISSLEIPDGYRLMMYDNADGSGGQCVFYGRVDYVGDDCNDMVSAVRFEIDPDKTLANDGHYCLYETESFRGLKSCSKQMGFQKVPDNLSGKVSAAFIPEGYVLKLYNNNDGTGRSCTVKGDVKNLSDNCNNMASSMALLPDYGDDE
jgi:hypothetical protein